MAKTILIVEDEKNIVDILSYNLDREGYATLEAYDGETGLQLGLEQDPDLILLDLMLPKRSGFDVCRSLRAAGHNTPVIMLTAREEETDKVLGLELGADDYITKPFSMRELLARVKANIRRVSMAPAQPDGVLALLRRLTVLDRHGHPADVGLYPGQQLPHGEGLGDIVVRPQLQAQDLVGLLLPGGEHQNGNGRARFPDFAADVKAIHSRQHQVQEN